MPSGPSIIDRMLKQTAVFWALTGSDGRGGLTFAAPIEVKVRWELKNEFFVDNEGNEILSEAVVYVDRITREGGWLFEGELADIDSSVDETVPQKVSESKQIKKFHKLPNFEASKFLNTAIL